MRVASPKAQSAEKIQGAHGWIFFEALDDEPSGL
jgi:hypothetical protein